MDEPLFLHQEPGPLFTTSESGRLMVRRDLSAETAARQMKHYAQRGWIFPRAQGEFAKFWAPSDIAAAATLSALVAGGVSDQEIMGFVSAALYAPQKSGFLLITHALHGIANGDYWRFDVHVMVDINTGIRRIFPVCYDADRHTPSVNGNFFAITTHTVNFTPLLLAIVAKIKTGSKLDA